MKKKKRKLPVPRSLVMLGMILSRKGGRMRHKTEGRAGNKNLQVKYRTESEE